MENRTTGFALDFVKLYAVVCHSLLKLLYKIHGLFTVQSLRDCFEIWRRNKCDVVIWRIRNSVLI